MVRAVREDDGSYPAARLRGVAEVRRSTGKSHHRAVAAGFSDSRPARVSPGIAGRYRGWLCGRAETEFILGLRVDGFGHGGIIDPQLRAGSAAGPGLLALPVLGAAGALVWVLQPRIDPAGVDALSDLHGLHRPADARGHA